MIDNKIQLDALSWLHMFYIYSWNYYYIWLHMDFVKTLKYINKKIFYNAMIANKIQLAALSVRANIVSSSYMPKLYISPKPKTLEWDNCVNMK